MKVCAPQDETHRGLLVVRSDDTTAEATGIATRAGLAARILAAWRDARRKKQRLFCVESPDGSSDGSRVVVLSLSMPGATFLLAMEREAGDPLFEVAASVEHAGELLSHLLNNPDESLLFVDKGGVLRYINQAHERFLGIQPGSYIGRHTTEVIENTRLHETAVNGKIDIGAMVEVRGVARVINRHPVRDGQGRIVGAVASMTVKGPDELQAMADELARVRSEVAHYRREFDGLRNRSHGLGALVGDSQAMRVLKQQINKIAPMDVPVLITGESGTGKELAARAIHELSSRHTAGMVIVNAAALPSTLVESELFGYEAGAFTGAERKGRRGKIDQADKSTLFLDEAGDIPADVQVKLLRVLQDGTYQRVGSNGARRSDFRLISASNCSFKEMVAAGRFRLDLFYRIAGVTIHMPSLRDRLEDIPVLAQLALEQFAQRHGQRPKTLSPEALDFLARQHWPGNVRQLMHCVERSAIFAEGDVIGPADFGPVQAAMGVGARVEEPRAPAAAVPPQTDSLSNFKVSSALGKVEEQLIRQAMTHFKGNKKRVAEELGVSRPYLYKRLGQMELTAQGAI